MRDSLPKRIWEGVFVFFNCTLIKNEEDRHPTLGVIVNTIDCAFSLPSALASRCFLSPEKVPHRGSDPEINFGCTLEHSPMADRTIGLP